VFLKQLETVLNNLKQKFALPSEKHRIEPELFLQ